MAEARTLQEHGPISGAPSGLIPEIHKMRSKTNHRLRAIRLGISQELFGKPDLVPDLQRHPAG